MGKPKARGIKKTGLYIWDDTEDKFVAWDGVLNDKFTTGSEPGVQVTDTNSHLLQDILDQLKIQNEYLLCMIGEENRLAEEDVNEFSEAT